ncbi:MAG TPA: TIGR00269 family protein [Thermoplasmata archaeon]|nr:TIGR00269 family protein [Thermoplasmata archaeon]
MRCDSCLSEAIVDRPYAHDHACERHLLESVRDRARREWHRQLRSFSRGTIAVALSGGKDSSAALELTHRYFARRPGVRLVAITIDEGIAGYRSASVARAGELAGRLGIEHEVRSVREELGTTTDAAAERLAGRAPCSFCGVWRRGLLNRAARAHGADALVLGFNLDDLAQTVLMNLARGEVERIGRMSPHATRRPGLVPRLAPLATVPEREVYLYARTLGLPFDHSECPHAGAAERNVFREVVWRLEAARPGTRQALLRTREAIEELLKARPEAAALMACTLCGEPSSHPVCRSCAFLRDPGHPVIVPPVSGRA